MRYRVLAAIENMQLTRALRLNSEFLEQRPNDQDAQDAQLTLLAELSMDEELMHGVRETIRRRFDRH